MIPAHLYYKIFLYSVIILTLMSFSTLTRNINTDRRKRNFFLAVIAATVFALFIGTRPISGKYFGDMKLYSQIFYIIVDNPKFQDTDSEWIWNKLMAFCSKTTDVTGFFLIVEIGYFGFTLWACKRLTNNNTLIALLFFMGALSFFSYGTNGIRNGLACAITLTFLAYIRGNFSEKLIAIFLAFTAYNIHHTTALPICMALLSLSLIPSFKTAYTFWILSIFISLIAGDNISSIFTGLGFDDRLTNYINPEDEDTYEQFSHTGFRWDFLIYSMMPILLGYYLVFRKGVKDKTYIFLLNTYTLSNAFWVMVIRSSFSNRFAYLSWFMYPLVLAYPLLQLNAWGKEQDTRLKQIMLANVGFTWFMSTFYW